MKALLVLCEGLHEIVFVQRSLGAVAGCCWVQKPIKNLPSPFGTIPGTSPKGLIARRIERNVDDLTLRSAAYPPLPQFQSAVSDEKTDTIFLLIRANGKDQPNAVNDLLGDVEESMGIGSVDVTKYAVAFLFDANTVGMTATLTKFRVHYYSHFGDLSEARHSKWVATAKCPVGVFVFHKAATDETGTLDDHLAPMVKSTWPDRYTSACGFIDDNRKPGDEVSHNSAGRLKAIITSAGQFDHPGSPMSTMIARDGIPKTRFETSPMSQALVDFLQGVPWHNY